MNKVVGVLSSNRVSATINPGSVNEAVLRLCGLDAESIDVRMISADNLDCDSLKGVNVLINTLGAYYPENGFIYIFEFYNNQGIILCIGSKPFTIPYVVENGVAQILPETVNALRTINLVNGWIPTGCTKDLKAKVLNSRYGFLNNLIESKNIPIMYETFSAYYNLSQTSEGDSIDLEPFYDAQLETVLGWVDSEGMLVSAPIARIDHFKKGSLILMNFTVEKRYYDTQPGIELVAGIIGTSLDKRVKIDVKSMYARYYEHEKPRLDLVIEDLNCSFSNNNVCSVKVRVFCDDCGTEVYSFENQVLSDNSTYLINMSIPMLKEGLYRVNTSVYYKDKLIAENKTGFYVLSKKSEAEILNNFKPVYIDSSVATDFCVRDGKPFAIHGTTYFVTDMYRHCFIDFNAYLCDLEMNELKNCGFNVLRSGNWMEVLTFFDDKGEIQEKSIRALQAYFLTAARHGLVVQYVLGAYVFNNWDREKCPIHNPEMQSKTICAFASFAEYFKGWTNVQLDAINEPSYSIKSLWQLARPSQDAFEKKNWIEWLRKKYEGNILKLRQAWNLSVVSLNDFEQAELPSDDFFQRRYNHGLRERYYYGILTDFFSFARESYSSWLKELAKAVKERDPKMMFMMGRDETIRIPSQQDEIFEGNIDMVNWHQWHKNAVVFAEYYLNKVKGVPCCGQEHGVYNFFDQRGNVRLTEKECSRILEKKLLYSFGNWVQWQAHNDPFMFAASEINLGLFRADKTETPYINVTRPLCWIEEKTAHLLKNRNEDYPGILMVHPTNHYFSVDSDFAARGVMNAMVVLHYNLKQQSDLVLEHLLRQDNKIGVGDPQLVIFPSFMMMSHSAWNILMVFLKEGKTVLLSGHPELDEYWRHVSRLKETGMKYQLKPVCVSESLLIDGKKIELSFREFAQYCDPAHVMDKVVYENESITNVKVFSIGKGKLIHCSIPVEMADDTEALEKLYEFSLREAGYKNRIFSIDCKNCPKNIMIYPISYGSCTVYTIVNEGNTADFSFTDLSSKKVIEMHLKSNRGTKIWLDKAGNLLGGYLNGRIIIDGNEIEPYGDLAIFKNGEKWDVMGGERENQFAVIFGRKYMVPHFFGKES